MGDFVQLQDHSHDNGDPYHLLETVRHADDESVHSPASATTPLRPIVMAHHVGSPGGGNDHAEEDDCDGAASLHSSAGSGCSRRLQIPTSLPDLDDASMRHVLAYVDHCELDLAWSTLSDSFFFVGGIAYVALSGFDLWAPQPQFADGVLYSFCSVFAPVVYLLNSIIDVKWARSIYARRSAQRSMTDHWHDWRVMLDLDDDDDNDDDVVDGEESPDGRPSDAVHLEGLGYRLHEPLDEIPNGDNATAPAPGRQRRRRLPPWLDRLRRHAAHRRNILAALTFGLAAVLAVVAVCIEYVQLDAAAQTAVALDAVSVHIYVISAVLSVSGKRTRPWLSPTCCSPSVPLWSSPEGLEDLGDLFFLVGSLVDAVLCDWAFGIDLPGWAMCSSLLWLLDALLYLRSDFIMAANLKRRDLDGGVIC